ncbi:MAG: hypothetical protein AAF702_21860 [Chloroflexota bacterium]
MSTYFLFLALRGLDIGDHFTKRGGHYITVWAPRQTGKTWVIFFIDYIDAENRQKYEVDFAVSVDATSQSTVTVHPLFISLNTK